MTFVGTTDCQEERGWLFGTAVAAGAKGWFPSDAVHAGIVEGDCLRDAVAEGIRPEVVQVKTVVVIRDVVVGKGLGYLQLCIGDMLDVLHTDGDWFYGIAIVTRLEG